MLLAALPSRLVARGLLLALLIIAPGCSDELTCADYAASGLSITVVDAASGAPICDATVTAVDGDFNQILEKFPRTSQPETCQYVGAWERNGTYTVTVTAPQYSPATQTVPVLRQTEDGCHIQGESAEIRLTHL